jgi:rhodanese-related sulfurtransferase
MKQIKRIYLVLLVLVLALAVFTGCQKKEETTAAAAAPAAPAAEASVDIDQLVNDYFAELPAHNNKIGQADFIDMVKAGADIVILDIRQPDVYAENHVKGAINAPWGTDLGEVLENLPTDKEVMVYCYSGQTAGQAVAVFKLAGVQARSVNLGYNLGISKVEGVDAALEQTANSFAGKSGASYDAAVKKMVNDYFTGLGDVTGTMFANYKISEDNAKKILDSGDDQVQFVSIRKAEDYAKGHIDTAINVPWGKGMQDGFASLPADKKLIVYCYTGQTAGQTVAALRVIGYDAVSLNGGMGMAANAPSGWANKGYPVVQ